MRTREGKKNMKDWQTYVRRHVAQTPPKLLHSIYHSIPQCSKPREPSRTLRMEGKFHIGLQKLFRHSQRSDRTLEQVSPGLVLLLRKKLFRSMRGGSSRREEMIAANGGNIKY